MNPNHPMKPILTAAGDTSDVTGKGKELEVEDQDVDELLAALGYTVKSSDMVDVAQKIEHLEGVFEHDDVLSQIASDSIHYNPSDLSSWLESMISELNPAPDPPIASDPFISTISAVPPPSAAVPVFPPAKKAKPSPSSPSSSSSYNPDPFISTVSAVPPPSAAVAPPSAAKPVYPPAKKAKPSPSSPSSSFSYNPDPTRNPHPNPHPNPVIIDSQENGIRLVHTLMACAEAVQQENYSLAENLVKQAGILAAAQAGAMRKVATYFAEALARRIYRLNPTVADSPAFTDLLQLHFYETCPYIKFAHFTANQAILEAFQGKKKVHVIDFSMKQGMQWPALMQALALRTGGPPSFRLTGIGPGYSDETDYLQEVGWKLAQLAETVHVEFEYRGFVAESLADIEPGLLDLRDDEVVAVNSVFELHRLLGRPGAFEKVMLTVQEIKPVIFTVVEEEANHNGLVFLERFTESLHYYSTLFDSLESGGGGGGCDGGIAAASEQDKIMSEVYLGKQICNVVACEGSDRVERHETLTQWKTRFDSAGFEAVHLGSNAFKQASMLLALFAGGDGYRVEENNGCLMLGWHTRPLITTSAWKVR